MTSDQEAETPRSLAEIHGTVTIPRQISFWKRMFAFAVALIATGQSSTITGTLAGQIVMKGFVQIIGPEAPHSRRGPRPGRSHRGVLRREGDGRASRSLPGGSFPSTVLRRDSAHPPRFGPALDRQHVIRKWLRIVAWAVAGIIVVPPTAEKS